MPGKKKSKGVLERIGDVATSAAEVVVDAGSKAIHAVGDLMPGGSSQKGTKASSKASKKKAPKASRKSSKAPAKSAEKASKPAVDARTKTVGPKAAEPAIKKSTAAKPATRAAKAAPKRAPARRVNLLTGHYSPGIFPSPLHRRRPRSRPARRPLAHRGPSIPFPRRLAVRGLFRAKSKRAASAIASSTVANRRSCTAAWIELSRSWGRWIVTREFLLQIPHDQAVPFLPSSSGPQRSPALPFIGTPSIRNVGQARRGVRPRGDTEYRH